MDEQDVKVILPPEINKDDPLTDETNIKKERGLSIGEIVKRVVPLILAGISVLFFSSSAVALGSALGIKWSDVGRIILGEFAGGMANVIYLSSDGREQKPPDRPMTGQADGTVPPSGNAQYLPSIDTDYVIGLNNETPYTPDMSDVLHRPRVIPTLDELYSIYGNGSPVVLIIHTHGSEGYADSASENYRTADKEKNVVAVGKVIADTLNAAGISTIHCDTLFDAEDFNMAYYNASLEIRKTISSCPSVSYIIDVHRDSVTLTDGTPIPLKCTVDEHAAAQLMLVIGTDHGGSGHTGWQNNLALAARLQYSVHTEHPNAMRNINLRSASFNQQYSDGSILLEVGTSANTLEEAKISAKAFADALIREIIGY